MHPETMAELEKMLLILKEEGEDAAFHYVRERLKQGDKKIQPDRDAKREKEN